MARPKKIEGATTASPADGTTTPDAGASTALASPAPALSSTEATDAGLPTEGVAEIAPTLPIASSVEATTEAPVVELTKPSDEPAKETIAEEVVPPSRRGDGTTLATTEGVTLPVEETKEYPKGAKLPEEISGVPAGVTLEELAEMGLPLPGKILTCALFETGHTEEGIVVSIHVELDVVNAWLRRSKRMWPIPAARIDGETWTHVNEDYPDPTVSASFDRLHRSEAAPPAAVPSEWLIFPEAEALPDLSAQGIVGTFEIAPMPSDSAASLAAQTKALLGVPDGYTLCKIKGLGSISGHGHRASDGKAMEEHFGGSMAYFSNATVRKLSHLLEIVAPPEEQS